MHRVRLVVCRHAHIHPLEQSNEMVDEDFGWSCPGTGCLVRSYIHAEYLVLIFSLSDRASTGNLVRFQYVIAYENTTNYYYGIANIAIWSIVESGTGIIAGSAPALAPLIKHIPIIGRGFIITPEGGQQATKRRWRLRHITNTFPSRFKTEEQSRPQPTERTDSQSGQTVMTWGNSNGAAR